MKSKILIVNFMFLLFSSNLFATVITSKITKIGCHINTSMCYVYLEEEITSDTCSNTSTLRWDSSAGFNMEALYSTLLSAHVAGKKVSFGGAGEVCYGNHASFVYATLNE